MPGTDTFGCSDCLHFVFLSFSIHGLRHSFFFLKLDGGDGDNIEVSVISKRVQDLGLLFFGEVVKIDFDGFHFMVPFLKAKSTRAGAFCFQERNHKMKTIEIYFDDLTKEKQAEILDPLGDNGNFDVVPIATIEFEEEEAMTQAMN